MKELKITIVVLTLLVLTGCADAVPLPGQEALGFWYGLWHGWIAAYAFIFSLFDDNVVIYAAHNSGGCIS